MKTQETAMSVATLANAGDLVANIAQGVMGDDVATTFNGSNLTRSAIYDLAQVEFQKVITNQPGAN